MLLCIPTLYIYIYTYIHVYACIYIYIYTYIHISNITSHYVLLYAISIFVWPGARGARRRAGEPIYVMSYSLYSLYDNIV